MTEVAAPPAEVAVQQPVIRAIRRKPYKTASKFSGKFQPHVARKPLACDGSVGPGSYGK